MNTTQAVRLGGVILVAAAMAGCADDAPTSAGKEIRSSRPSALVAGRDARNYRRSTSRSDVTPMVGLDHVAGHPAGVIISNSVVQLGVNPEGHLNVPNGQPSSGYSSTTDVGLRFVQTQSEATAPGCLCEGWGVADATAGVSGFASIDNGGVSDNLEVESFTHTTSTAVSTVLIRHPTTNAPWLRVTHDYHPSTSTQYLYEATVTVQNLSGQTVDLRYRRVMDWDIAPNTFNEYSTIQGTSGNPTVLYASDNGFEEADALGSRSTTCGNQGDFVDQGPCDHGAMFDFGFGGLPAGQSKQFIIFYGAAGSETLANFALSQVGAEVYSLGQPSIDYSAGPGSACMPWTPAPENSAPDGFCGAERGEPHTFMFAFRSVGGAPVFRPLDVTLNISPRPISLTKSTLVTVWLPSTSSFDATKTVAASATLGNESDPEASITTLRGAPYAMTGDFNRDGLTDMAFVFRVSDLRATGDLHTGTTRLVLRASHSTAGLIRADGPVSVIP